MKPREIIANVFEQCLPFFVIMNLINKQMSSTMRVMVVYHIYDIMSTEPQIVK